MVHHVRLTPEADDRLKRVVASIKRTPGSKASMHSVLVSFIMTSLKVWERKYGEGKRG